MAYIFIASLATCTTWMQKLQCWSIWRLVHKIFKVRLPADHADLRYAVQVALCVIDVPQYHTSSSNMYFNCFLGQAPALYLCESMLLTVCWHLVSGLSSVSLLQAIERSCLTDITTKQVLMKFQTGAEIHESIRSLLFCVVHLSVPKFKVTTFVSRQVRKPELAEADRSALKWSRSCLVSDRHWTHHAIHSTAKVFLHECEQ